MHNENKITYELLKKKMWIWGVVNGDELTRSFCFGENGQIEGYKNSNEDSWKIENGILYIYNTKKDIFWKFSSVSRIENEIALFSYPQIDKNWKDLFFLHAPDGDVTGDDSLKNESDGNEQIRLVIWDLDDTFWNGTLSEGEIAFLEKNISIVKELNSRGIVNSICSKNTFEDVKNKLESIGIWDEFVFPKISWSAKGPQVVDIIEKIQLRPETVIFIDDNVTNLNEVKHFIPKINIAEPDILDGILENTRFIGKPDPNRNRLQRYRILETKHTDMAESGNDNEDFLKKSNIRISFHTDVEEQFSRIHDLVNRTNQLNFTKNRWPEDIEEARTIYRNEIQGDFGVDAGYIKVSDNYGNYGICGFYISHFNTFRHFLFSCRSMNMGVEQFVWRFLNKREVPINGSVASNLSYPVVNWIKVVGDADIETGQDKEKEKLKVCLRGACDLMQTANFMRRSENIEEEFNYAYEGWEIATTPRIIHLHEDLKDEKNRQIIKNLPGIPEERFNSSIIREDSDVYVLSFSQESFHGLYKSKTTGMIIPMGSHKLPYYHPEGPNYKFDLTGLSFEDVYNRGLHEITQEQWNFFQNEFSFIGGYNEDLFLKDVDYVFRRLIDAKKLIVVLGLNDNIGRDIKIIEFFKHINLIVKEKCFEFGIKFLEISHFIKNESQLADDGIFGGTHFNRLIYKEISDYLLESIRNLWEEHKISS